MKVDNNTLRILFAKYSFSKIPTNRGKCPSPKLIARSFSALSSRRKKEKVIEHITECPFCRDEFMFYCKLQGHSNLSIENTDRISKKIFQANNNDNTNVSFSLKLRFAVLFIGIVLVISSVVHFIGEGRFSEVERSGQVEILPLYPTTTHLAQEELIFKWKKHNNLHCYILELYDETLLPIWTSQKTPFSEVPLPAEIALKFTIGKYYYWMVTGYSTGANKAESRLSRFRVLAKK